MPQKQLQLCIAIKPSETIATFHDNKFKTYLFEIAFPELEL